MNDSSVKNENRLSLGVKLGYGVGDLAANLVFQSVVLFLMFYFTDVFGIAAPVAGTIFLVSKIWDGITDPVMGYISDRTKSRWGKKRPYLLFGAVPLGLSLVMLFYSPDISASLKPYYAAFSFLFLCTAYTVVNIPYGAMTSSLTLDYSERSSLTGYRMFFAILGTLIVAGVTKPVAEGMFDSPAAGYRAVMGVFASAAVVFTLVTFFTVKECVEDTAGVGTAGIKDIPEVIRTNPPFILLTLGMVLHLGAFGIIASMVNFYFKYNMGNAAFTTVAMMCLFIPAVAALPLWVILSDRFSKKSVFNAGMGLSALMLFALYFIKDLNPALLIPVFVLMGIGISTLYLSPWSMIPDTVEYAQRRTGFRREGILYGFFYFSQKISAALAGFISGHGLGMIGFRANEIQSSGVLDGIRILITFVPITMIVLGIIAVSFYPIDREMHTRLISEIDSASI